MAMDVSNVLTSENDLEEYILDVENWITSLVADVGLTRESIEAGTKASCPINSDHRMPESNLQKHLQFCSRRNQGYTDDEIKEELSSKIFYENADSAVPLQLDIVTVRNICSSIPGYNAATFPSVMPLTVDRYMKEFTTQQRLKIYEHVTQVARNTKKQTQLSAEQYSFLTVDLIKKQKKADENKPKSKMEELAMKRDLKRRRQSYKGKSYSARKTQKQLIADVIQNQTEILRELWVAENDASRVADGHDTHERTSILRHDNDPLSGSQDTKSHVHEVTEGELGPVEEGSRSRDHDSKKKSSHKRKKRSRSHSRSPKPKKKDRNKSEDREHRREKKSKKEKK